MAVSFEETRPMSHNGTIPTLPRRIIAGDTNGTPPTNGHAATAAPAATVPPRPAGKPWPLAEAAAFLGVSEKTITRAIADERLRAAKFGRRVLIPDSEVRRVAESGI
jgi:excisionase family DNA binding protein